MGTKMYLPKPSSQSYPSLLQEIEKGQIKIPQFQRNFVWSVSDSAKLMDSIIKGYPIGTFIFWRTKEQLRSVRNLGNITLPNSEDGEYVDYVLDGQQRLTSLLACLRGAIIKRDNKEDDFSKIYIDLTADYNQDIVITDVSKLDATNYISILDLLNADLVKLVSEYASHVGKIDKYRNSIKTYEFSIVQFKEAPIEIATEVFTRINTGGKSLTLFEIMVAKTFDEKQNFDLSEKFEKLLEELSEVGYETISDASILQIMSLILQDECTRHDILKIPRQKFIDTWNDLVEAVKNAVDYFRSSYRIPVSQLLPYNALLVPFSYFFYKEPNAKPSKEQAKYLQDFFWRCALAERYSSAVESKLAQDIKRINKIIKNEKPNYDWDVDSSVKAIEENGWFSAGKSYIKAILCIYAYQQPKSFSNNANINIGNDWLKQANSKNYHHFFPKSYLNKQGAEEFYINHILNITIVDDFLNKREIGAQKPSKYMKKFQQENDELDQTMKTHLIPDLEKFGIWDDDYDTFFEERAKLVSKEIKKRLLDK